ncbi:unnamed protein product [Gordionus sp. m RMFG-2023]
MRSNRQRKRPSNEESIPKTNKKPKSTEADNLSTYEEKFKARFSVGDMEFQESIESYKKHFFTPPIVDLHNKKFY